MTKKLLAFGLALALLLTLCACGETVGCTIYYPVYEKMTSCDPQIAASDIEKIIVTNCFEGLVRVDENGDLAPAAAADWSISPDGLTYTFRLRSDGAWHLTDYAAKELADRLPANMDTRVTADDFVFALHRALDPATGAPDAYMLYSIENARALHTGTAAAASLGVRAVSDTTLEIRLAEPQSDFLYILTECVAMPCKQSFFEACGGRYGLLVKYFLSNGAFYLSKFTDDDTYTLTASPAYTGAHKATPARVQLYYNADGTGVPAKITDEIYSGAYLTQRMFNAASLSDKTTVTELNNSTVSFLFNLNDAVLQNDKLREAFCLATDTAALADAAAYPYAQSLVPAICGQQPVCVNDVSETLAAERLREALAELELPSVTLDILTADEYVDIIKRQMQSWQRILGVSCILRVTGVSSVALETRVAAGDYRIAFCPVTAKTPDALGFLLGFSENCPDNCIFLQNEGYTRTLNAAKAAGSAQETERFIAAAAQYLTDNHYILPVFSENAYLVETTGVTGIYCYTCQDRVYFNRAFSKN